MRTLLTLFASALTVSAAPILPPPSNPSPVIQFAWDASVPGPGLPVVTNYNLWYGVGTGAYTNKVAVGNVLTAPLTLPARGIPFFVVVNAEAGGLASPWSNEVSVSADPPPPVPNQHPPVKLVVQSKSTIQNQWADTPMDWSLSAEQSTQMFRLRIDKPITVAQIQPMVIRTPVPAALSHDFDDSDHRPNVSSLPPSPWQK